MILKLFNRIYIIEENEIYSAKCATKSIRFIVWTMNSECVICEIELKQLSVVNEIVPILSRW